MIILSLMMSFYSQYLPDFTFELKSLNLSILMSVSSILFSCFLIILHFISSFAILPYRVITMLQQC